MCNKCGCMICSDWHANSEQSLHGYIIMFNYDICKQHLFRSQTWQKLNFKLVVNVRTFVLVHMVHVLCDALGLEAVPWEKSAATMGVAILVYVQQQRVCHMCFRLQYTDSVFIYYMYTAAVNKEKSSAILKSLLDLVNKLQE